MASKKEIDKLKTAINSLNIRGVYLSASETTKQKGFSSANHKNEIKIQSFNNVISCDLADVNGNKTDDYAYIYSFMAGIRLIDADDADDADDKANTLLKVEASFEALYSSKEKLGEDCITAFGEQNVTFHVWPYWREYVQNICTRMGLDPLPVPFFINDIKSEKPKLKKTT